MRARWLPSKGEQSRRKFRRFIAREPRFLEPSGVVIAYTPYPFRIVCGGGECGAWLASARSRGARALLRGGFEWDGALGLWRLSGHAGKEWSRAKAQGVAWDRFRPRARHAVEPANRRLPAGDVEHQPAVELALPACILCPLCEAENEVAPGLDSVGDAVL